MERQTIIGSLSTSGRLSGALSVGGGTTDYNELENKPTYNGHIIEGDMTNETLGIWQPKNFSTEEQNTGLKWINGKDIYFKTLTFTIGSETVFTIDNTIQYDDLIMITGNVKYTDVYTDLMPYVDPNDYCLIRIKSGVLECAISNYFKNNGNVKATIFYTKN